MRIPNLVTLAATVLALLGLSGGLRAQQSSFARAGSATFSAERLTGVFVNDASFEADGVTTVGGTDVDVAFDTEGTTTSVALLGNGTDAGPAGVPRLAFDYFVIQSLSIGGSFTYASSRDESEDRTLLTAGGTMTEGVSDVDVTTSVLSFSPRIGYGVLFTNHIGLWGRGGITYTRFSEESETTQREPDTLSVQDLETVANLWSVSLDAQLILSPIDHVAFGIGPHLGIPVTGNIEITNNLDDSELDGDASLTEYGVSASLLCWF